MGKKLTNADKWKMQRWFRLLQPYHKLAWEYISAICDVDGTWEINCLDLVDDLRIPVGSFNLMEFIKACNSDYHHMTGEEIQCERVVLVGEKYLWLTGYVSLQNESMETRTVSPFSHFARSAFNKLAGKGIFNQALLRGYIPLSIPLEDLSKGLARPLTGGLYIDVDVDIDKEIIKKIDVLYNDYKDRNGVKGGRKGKNKKSDYPGDNGEGQIPFTPPNLPEMTQEQFAEFENCLVADSQFIESIMMGRGIKNDKDLRRWIKLFHANIIAEKNTRKDYPEYRKHFKNWIGTQKDTHKGPPKITPPANGASNANQNGVSPMTPAELVKYQKTPVNLSLIHI